MMVSIETRGTNFLNDQWACATIPGDINPDPTMLFKTMTSGKWRRSALDDASRRDIQDKIEHAISKDAAIEFSVPFGGYKSWTLHSYPHLNWADVFAVNFLRRFGEDVAQFGRCKVVITFSYCSGVMDLVNNMRLDEQDLYTREFQKLLDAFSDSRVQMALFDIADKFRSLDALRERVRDGASVVSQGWETLDQGARLKRLRSAERNLQRNGVEDLRALDEQELESRIERSAMFCEALDCLPERREFNKFSSRIQLVHVRGPTPSIHLASCDTSSNHFGVGDGVVEVRRDRCLQRIVTGGIPENSVELDLQSEERLTRGFAGLGTAHLIDATTSR